MWPLLGKLCLRPSLLWRLSVYDLQNLCDPGQHSSVILIRKYPQKCNQCIFFSAFSGSFIGQSLLKKHLPYGKNAHILVSSVLATGISYQVTTHRTKCCQAAWMAAEDKHTYFKESSVTEDPSA